MRRSWLPPLLIGLIALLWQTAQLRAAPRQVVVLEGQFRGELRAEERARIGDALWAALDRLGLRRVADIDREAILSGEAELRGCLMRDECLERLGHLLEATHAIGVVLTRTAPTAFQLEVRLFDVDVGEDGAAIKWSCTACGVEQVARHLDTLVESAVQKDAERPRATLLVRSVPPNADVQIDGRKVGFTELVRHVFAGPHDVVVSLPGMAPERTHLDLSGEQRLHLSFSLGVPRPIPLSRPLLVPVPVRTSEVQTVNKGPHGRSRWKLWVGIPLAVVGAAVGVLGATTLGLNGHCATEMDGRCLERYAGSGIGGAEVGIGGVLFGVGAGLIIREGVEQSRARRE